MPFRSQQQRKFFHAVMPDRAREWERRTPKKRLPKRAHEVRDDLGDPEYQDADFYEEGTTVADDPKDPKAPVKHSGKTTNHHGSDADFFKRTAHGPVVGNPPHDPEQQDEDAWHAPRMSEVFRVKG